MTQMTQLELTDKEAQLFVEFQKHHVLMELLKSVHAFDMRNGSVTINFNHLGQIKSITKEEHFNQ